jgi:hypothetical protein
MKLTGIGSVNCTGTNGYSLLSFRVNQTGPTAEPPENVTIQMFSANSTSDYFYTDLTGNFTNSTVGIWNNITLNIGPSAGWASAGFNPDWSNITGLQLNFTWTSSSNESLLMVGLFFHGPYKSLADLYGPSYYADVAFYYVLHYFFLWILITGLVYVLIKAWKGKVGWKPMLITVGIIMMTFVVGSILTALGNLTVPTVYYKFDFIGGVQGEGKNTLNTILNQTYVSTVVSLIAQLLSWVWTIALLTIAVRTGAQMSWAKSVAIAALAFIITVVVASFLSL